MKNNKPDAIQKATVLVTAAMMGLIYILFVPNLYLSSVQHQLNAVKGIENGLGHAITVITIWGSSTAITFVPLVLMIYKIVLTFRPHATELEPKPVTAHVTVPKSNTIDPELEKKADHVLTFISSGLSISVIYTFLLIPFFSHWVNWLLSFIHRAGFTISSAVVWTATVMIAIMPVVLFLGYAIHLGTSADFLHYVDLKNQQEQDAKKKEN